MDERHAAQTIRAVLGTRVQWPEESLVVAGVDRAGSVVGIATLPLDVEVPALLVPEFAREIEGRLTMNGAVSAVGVAVTSADLSLGCDLADDLAAHWWGLELTHQWSVAGGAYREPGCADAACCPPGGKPLDHASAISAEQRRRAHRAADRFLRRRDSHPARWHRDAWSHVWAVLGGDEDPLVVGKANAALTDVRVRDALIVFWASGDSGAAEDVLVGRETAGVTEALESLVGEKVVAPPAAAVEGCRVLSAYARPSERVVVDALNAVLAWRSGDDAAAERLAGRALDGDPGYTLAVLISRLAAAREGVSRPHRVRP